MSPEQFMQTAVEEAQRALTLGEVPIGAVITYKSKIIAQDCNQTITKSDPTAHAEMLCIQSATKKLGNHRLNECELFVTLEPCLMCLGAISQARIKKVYYATNDRRSGLISNGISTKTLNLNWHADFELGPCQEACQQMLVDFFKTKR